MSGEQLPTASMKVKELIEEYPGLHMRELARRSGIDVRAAKHHLDRLEKSGFVTVRYFGRFKRYFPRKGKHGGEVVDRRDKLSLGYLRNPTSLGLVVCLIANGPSRLVDLSREVGVSSSKASFHLRKLEMVGIVVRRTGSNLTYDLRDAKRVRELLRTYGPMPDQVDGLLDLWDTIVRED